METHLNRKNIKRLISFAICLVMLLIPLSGCDGKGGSDSSDSTSSFSLDVKTVDLNQRTIKIYMYGFRKKNMTESADGRRFLERVAELEKAFNCKIDIPEDDNYTAVWNSVLSGKPSHDIMQITAPHLFAQPATNGIFLDLDQYSDAFDLNSEKWNKETNALFTLSGKRFGLSVRKEDVSRFDGNLVMYFNKRLVKQVGYDPEDLYTLQNEGKWTWSKFEEIATKVAALSAGENKIYGSIGNAYQLYNGLCVSNGANWITKDESGAHFNGDDPLNLEALDFMLKLHKNGIIPTDDTFNDSKQFLEGKVGFIPEYIERLKYAEGYGGMQDDFGLLMFPKADKAENYISIDDWYSGWGLLTGIQEPEKVAVLLNAFTESTYPDKNELEQLKQSTYTSWVRDEGSLEVFKLMEKATVVSPVGFASPVDTQWKDQIKQIVAGQKTSAQALQEVKNQYEDTLKGLWEYIGLE